ncbi:hypothetical protein GOV10_06350 [Candidatus Woesearchaeota archaeon]|nr:hypothetical protein [Candidatus Woesearchaeota archaeon]
MKLGSFQMDDLYVFIGGVITVMGAYGAYELHANNQQELAKIELEIAQATAVIEPITRDVLGRGGSETFIEVDGKKWYSTIDDTEIEELYK